MEIASFTQDLHSLGMSQDASILLSHHINDYLQRHGNPEQAWQAISKILLTDQPFAVHLAVFNFLFPLWHQRPESAPAWLPEPAVTVKSNVHAWLQKKRFAKVSELQQWTHYYYASFWQEIIDHLGIVFKKDYTQIVDISQGVENPQWLVGAKLNIADSCFLANDDATAIIYSDQAQQLHRLSYAELNILSNHIAYSLNELGYHAGDAIAIAMPMTHYAVAIYLGIIKMGGVVVSIADSFSSGEMATRLKIANAKLVFTQDFITWDHKSLPLYEKVREAHAGQIIIVPSEISASIEHSTYTLTWADFFKVGHDYQSIACDPMSACNILFSSGTTGEPKAIVWNHTTPIKAASDGYFHQDIKSGDVFAWPTNLGWMMGPWLVFATLINKATIALYHDAPKGEKYGKFIENTKVTQLGVVPTLVAAWRQSNCMLQCDWHRIKLFTSTGECSNPEDMLYLMSLANYKPVIEYCGGTEIGGAYISSTIIEKNYPSLFSTPTFGLNFVLLDENKQPSDVGEVAIIPPSIGLSTQLLNANHHDIYFKNMPLINNQLLRRHGDLAEKFPNNYYCILGRTDDTMNLGGIKISAAEIERTLSGLEGITEVAAIAIAPINNGPSELVIYLSTPMDLQDKTILQKECQQRINTHLNPLFKISDIVCVRDLPKTASNKIMRRMLRKQYFDLLNQKPSNKI